MASGAMPWPQAQPPFKASGRPASLKLQVALSHSLLLLALQAVLCATAHGDDLLQELHARVYVADLPPKYNLHIIANEGCEEGHILKEMLANPLGPLFEGSLDKALYRETPYYGLELYIHLQMLSSPLRVLNMEEADIVYVPFYGTQLWGDLVSGHQIFASTNRSSCQPTWYWADQDQLIAQFWADAPTLLPLLGSKPHWMGLSDIEWMIHRGCGEAWGIPLACHPLAEHVTFTTAEALTKEHPTAYLRSHFYGNQPAHNNSVPVPYLGHVHRVSIHARDKQLADEAVAANKTLLATLSFASMRDSPLRVALAEECQAAPDECLFVPFTSLLEVIGTYRAAWFCVQPYGDTPTRSALLDCLASGLAVPAVFDEYLFAMLPFADVLDYRSLLVYVPEENVTGSNGSLLQSLREYSNDTRAALLESVQRAAHAFQYAVQPNHLLVRYDSLHVVHPLDDAFTMSFKAVLRHACQHGHTHSRCHHFRHHKG